MSENEGPKEKEESGKSPECFVLSNSVSRTSQELNNMDSSVDNKVLRMMKKMGYKIGSGLGKNEQGITESIKINTNLEKRGLGLCIKNFQFSSDTWDFLQDDIIIEESVNWLENNSTVCLTDQHFENWLTEGTRRHSVEDSNFCHKDIFKNVFQAKEIFDELDNIELYKARTRANPFETIKSVFFMNRAALKMANIDAATGFIFTNMENEAEFKTEKGPIFFADVCAGPGGFSEYIFWRKSWLYKGFGLTLKDENDFKITESRCTTAVMFQALYGSADDGDVTNPENISDFTDRVKHETEGGVHFMMSDGGFSVDGNENLQEVLSKNIYLCQCLLAIKVLKPHGSFVTKLFDLFTNFSVGLLYLIYLCFERVAILKPNSSRPANSERYFICQKLKDNTYTNSIREYLWRVALRLWELKDKPDREILEIVPLHILEGDVIFKSYIVKSNNLIGSKQIIALKKLAQFCRNPQLIDLRQNELRIQCLKYWKIPDEKKKSNSFLKIDEILLGLHCTPDLVTVPPRCIKAFSKLNLFVTHENVWKYCYLISSAHQNRCHFFVATGNSHVFRLQNGKWMKVKHLELIPGTLLYGEFVQEKVVMDSKTINYRYSLHVIDAAFLGSKNLQTCNFEERFQLIQMYCKAVNKESQSKYCVRVRPKVLKELSDLSQDITKNGLVISENYLPSIGYKSETETCEVNSILLLRTDESQSFQSTYVSRLQILNTKENKTLFEKFCSKIENNILM